MRFRELLKCKHESNGGIPYQEVVVHERPGLPRDHLRPLRTPLSQPLPARVATEAIGTMSTDRIEPNPARNQRNATQVGE
jgi:hypothetical protein